MPHEAVGDGDDTEGPIRSMVRHLEFGKGSLDVAIDESKVIGSFKGPKATPIDLRQTIHQSLAEPLDAPAYARSLTPGDHIVLIVDRGLPHLETLIEPILDCLASSGVSFADVTVLLAPLWFGESARPTFADRYHGVQIVEHNPHERAEHGYLASAKEGRRIYLNRRVLDADTVLVIGRTGYDWHMGIRGTATDVFPALSDAETLKWSRRAAMEARHQAESLRRRQLSDEVGWLMGLYYAVGVALDRFGEVDSLWVGAVKSVQAAAEQHIRRCWLASRPRETPDLVIATVAPSGRRARWAEVAGALDSACRLAPRGSNIVVLSDLREPLGPTGAWLQDCDNPWEVLARVRESDDADALPTTQLAHALSSHKVFLHSALDEETVESLSMVPISGARALENLQARSERIFLFEDADRARMAR